MTHPNLTKYAVEVTKVVIRDYNENHGGNLEVDYEFWGKQLADSWEKATKSIWTRYGYKEELHRFEGYLAGYMVGKSMDMSDLIDTWDEVTERYCAEFYDGHTFDERLHWFRNIDDQLYEIADNHLMRHLSAMKDLSATA